MIEAEPVRVVLWYWTTGPRFKRVEVIRLTPLQVITVDAHGEEERFWRRDGLQVGGASHLMTADEAERVVEKWHAKNAQRGAMLKRGPVLVPPGNGPFLTPDG